MGKTRRQLSLSYKSKKRYNITRSNRNKRRIQQKQHQKQRHSNLQQGGGIVTSLTDVTRNFINFVFSTGAHLLERPGCQLSSYEQEKLWPNSFLENDRVALGIWKQWIEKLQEVAYQTTGPSLPLSAFLDHDGLYGVHSIEAPNVFGAKNMVENYHLSDYIKSRLPEGSLKRLTKCNDLKKVQIISYGLYILEQNILLRQLLHYKIISIFMKRWKHYNYNVYRLRIMQVLSLSRMIKKMRDQMRVFNHTFQNMQSLWEVIVGGQSVMNEEMIMNSIQPDMIGSFQAKIKSSNLSKEQVVSYIEGIQLSGTELSQPDIQTDEMLPPASKMIRDWEQPTPLPFQPPQTSEKMEPSLQMSQEAPERTPPAQEPVVTESTSPEVTTSSPAQSLSPEQLMSQQNVEPETSGQQEPSLETPRQVEEEDQDEPTPEETTSEAETPEAVTPSVEEDKPTLEADTTPSVEEDKPTLEADTTRSMEEDKPTLEADTTRSMEEDKPTLEADTTPSVEEDEPTPPETSEETSLTNLGEAEAAKAEDEAADAEKQPQQTGGRYQTPIPEHQLEFSPEIQALIEHISNRILNHPDSPLFKELQKNRTNPQELFRHLKHSQELDEMISRMFDEDDHVLQKYFQEKSPFEKQFIADEPFPVSNLEELTGKDVCLMVQELQMLIQPSCQKIYEREQSDAAQSSGPKSRVVTK